MIIGSPAGFWPCAKPANAVASTAASVLVRNQPLRPFVATCTSVLRAHTQNKDSHVKACSEAYTVRAGVTGSALVAACVAVVGIRPDIDFAAIRRIQVAVGKARCTRADTTDTPEAAGRAVREAADMRARSAVGRGGVQVHLAPIQNIAIAITKPRDTGHVAVARRAGRGCIRSR